MRLIPEYEPVRSLALCFVDNFFNTRFHYGEAQAAIIRAAYPHVRVEALVAPAEMETFQAVCTRHGVTPDMFTLQPDSPGRAILAEGLPIFARDEQDEDGKGYGLIFRNPWLDDEVPDLEAFSRRFCQRAGFQPLEAGFPFATAHLLVNEELVLLADTLFEGAQGTAMLEFFTSRFPGQTFVRVPPLAGELTRDLDMFLWPIAPRAWIVSEYPRGTAQADSIAPALRALEQHGHTVHRVPGLEPIRREDINTMPNYANGVILNQAALVPAYGVPEDEIVQGILREYGYEVAAVDCSQVILTNSGIHCIVKTAPA